MFSTNFDLLILAFVWLVYFLLHSLFASLSLKRRVAQKFPAVFRYYRIAFNVLAIVLIIPPLWLMHSLAGEVLWQWKGVASYLSNFLGLLAVIGFVWSMRYYDGMSFLGVRASAHVEDQEQFCLSPLHHFVRHPWYFLAIVLIWSRDMDAAFLVSAVFITLYFIVGSGFEEKKLLVFHGEVYRRYRRYVPGLFPLPWRYLTKAKRNEVLSQKK